MQEESLLPIEVYQKAFTKEEGGAEAEFMLHETCEGTIQEEQENE